jgi:molybdopterin synthase catalytic subunit
MNITLTDHPLDPWQALQDYQTTQAQLKGKHGAMVTFVGSMRDMNEGDAVQSMYLEHYPEMTQKHMEKIAGEALARWNILDVMMQHRYGDIRPNDTIVVLAVWSAHREEAFAACRFLIEELKHRAPFWKKEILTDTDNNAHDSRWVQQQRQA